MSKNTQQQKPTPKRTRARILEAMVAATIRTLPAEQRAEMSELYKELTGREVDNG